MLRVRIQLRDARRSILTSISFDKRPNCGTSVKGFKSAVVKGVVRAVGCFCFVVWVAVSRGGTFRARLSERMITEGPKGKHGLWGVEFMDSSACFALV